MASGDFVFRHTHDAGRATAYNVDRLGDGITAGHAVGEGRRRIGRHGASLLEGQGNGRRTVGDNADDVRLQPQQISYRDEAADARSHADRHVDRIEVGHGLEQLQRVGRHAFHQIPMKGGHEMVAAFLGKPCGMRPAFIEIGADNDQLAAEGLHRRVLLARIADRHENGARHACARRRKCDRLAMIAARGGDDAVELRGSSLEPIEIDNATPHLEGADGRVVLVLDPHLRARTLRQQRPGMLRRRRHDRAHERNRRLQFLQREEWHRRTPGLSFERIATCSSASYNKAAIR